MLCHVARSIPIRVVEIHEETWIATFNVHVNDIVQTEHLCLFKIDEAKLDSHSWNINRKGKVKKQPNKSISDTSRYNISNNKWYRLF
jgi:hypothetical protein